MKIKKQKPSTIKLIIGAALAALLVVQTVLMITVWSDVESLNEAVSQGGDYRYNGFADTYVTEPIVDSAMKRVYLPGVDLYMPLTIGAMDLTYRVADAGGGGTTDLIFMSKLNSTLVSNQVDMPEDCQDLVRVEISASQAQPRSGETALAPFTLSDGRKVYTYEAESQLKCKGLPVSPQLASESIRQLNSY